MRRVQRYVRTAVLHKVCALTALEDTSEYDVTKHAPITVLGDAATGLMCHALKGANLVGMARSAANLVSVNQGFVSARPETVHQLHLELYCQKKKLQQMLYQKDLPAVRSPDSDAEGNAVFGTKVIGFAMVVQMDSKGDSVLKSVHRVASLVNRRACHAPNVTRVSMVGPVRKHVPIVKTAATCVMLNVKVLVSRDTLTLCAINVVAIIVKIGQQDLDHATRRPGRVP